MSKNPPEMGEQKTILLQHKFGFADGSQFQSSKTAANVTKSPQVSRWLMGSFDKVGVRLESDL
jgi:hypothetical protein